MGTGNKGKVQVHMDKSWQTYALLLLITAIGIGMTIWGISEIRRVNAFRAVAQETTGTVVDFERGEDEDDDDIYYAIYEYSVEGVCYTVEDDDYSYFEPDMGETGIVYYNPNEPEEAAMSLDAGLGAVLVAVGLIFALAGFMFVLASFHVNEAVIQILVGLILVIIGFVLPIVVRDWLMMLATGIFGIVGVIMIIKTITKLTGHEGGAIDQAIDEKLEAAGELIQDVVEAQEEGFGGGVLSEVDISPVLYLPQIIKGIGMLFPAVIFFGVGAFFIVISILTMDFFNVFVGGIFVAVGIVVFIKAIGFIKEGIDLRKQHKNIG